MSTMTTKSTREMCQDQAQSTVEILEDLWRRLDDLEGQEDPEADDVRAELDEMPLEIVWAKGEPFAIVLGTGGPHVEIRGGTRHDGQTYAVHVYWSGEHVVYGHASQAVQRTGDYFREMVEES